MDSPVLTNLLLTGILLLQAFAIIFRAPAVKQGRNSPKFPVT